MSSVVPVPSDIPQSCVPTLSLPLPESDVDDSEGDEFVKSEGEECYGELTVSNVHLDSSDEEFTELSHISDEAFDHTGSYDESVSGFMKRQFRTNGSERCLQLNNFGNGHNSQNHKEDMHMYTLQEQMPIKVLNGSPGYINILDALNAWQLVKELKTATGQPAAASFRHVSPTGAAIGLMLNEAEQQSYMVTDMNIPGKVPSLAAAYARARGADRMAAFGDFIALSDRCDELTAKMISRELSDGVIAPGYDDAAMSILAKKKNGNYTVLKIDPRFLPSDNEVRTIFGLKLKQKRIKSVITPDDFLNVVSQNKLIPKSVIDDLLVASIAIKYTQSSSVCFAHRGQVIGMGAGQQSRMQCARLAGEKAANWWLRQHERVLNLPWKSTIKRSEKTTAIDVMVSGMLGGDDVALEKWNAHFTEPVEPFSQDERRAWLKKLTDVVVSSDACFSYRDSIDCARQFGARYIACNSGPSQEILDICNEYGLVLIHTGRGFIQQS